MVFEIPFEMSISFSDVEIIIRVLVAVLLGGIVGYEREKSKKPAGLRTHIFVSMGACLFTVASFYLLPGNIVGSYDSTRIAAGVVAGISFIGAGSIIALKGDVKGLTTAASLWVVSAIGMILGLGNYVLPVLATIISFIVLRLDKIETKSKE